MPIMTLVGGIFGDRPCESINRKLCPLSVPFVPLIKTPKAEPPSNGNLDGTQTQQRFKAQAT